MDVKNPEAERYLAELFRRTAGNVDAQVSMFEIGAAVGLEKEGARRLAEDLIAEGLVEIKTLSGGIGITAQGIDAARPDAVSAAGTAYDLGQGPVLEEPGRQALETIITEIKNQLATNTTAFEKLEEMVIDIKTIDIQLLSPRPKNTIIKAVLASLKDGLQSSSASSLTSKVERMIGKG